MKSRGVSHGKTTFTANFAQMWRGWSIYEKKNKLPVGLWTANEETCRPKSSRDVAKPRSNCISGLRRNKLRTVVPGQLEYQQRVAMLLVNS